MKSFSSLKRFNKKIIGGVGVALGIIALVAMIVFYSLFTTSHIFSESASHLQEIYKQVNVNFTSIISKYWNVLRCCANYIEEKSEDDAQSVIDFVNERRNDWGFTNFYFVDDDGNGKFLDGEEFDLGFDEEQINSLITGKEIVHNGVRETDGMPVNIFAIPNTPDEAGNRYRIYKGFRYCAMAITYTRDDMSETLNIDAFDHRGRCFVIDPDGVVLMSSEGLASDNEDFFSNFLEHLKSEHVSEYDEIVKGIAEDKTDVLLYTAHGDEYYISYQPVTTADGSALNDWTIIGIVPAGVLNASMNEFRTVTIVIMCGIFVLLAVGGVVIVVFINRRHVQVKNLELQSRESLFDQLTINNNDIYVLFSPEDFKAQYVSPNVERVLGISAEEVCNDIHAVLQACPENYPRFTTEGLSKIERGATRNTEFQMHNIKTAEKYWFSMRLYRCDFTDADNFILLLSDHTKDKSLNAQLEQALELAKAANSAKSNFLSNMSHDIRTPMNAIIGFTTLLARNAKSPEMVRDYTKKIAYSSQHLLGLINDILDMSKIESGKTSLNSEEFSMSELLESLYSIILPQAKAKKQKFEMHIKGVLPERLMGDRLRLNQILLNLLSNAVKYTQVGGQIELLIERIEQSVHNHAHIRFIVKDNGYGMSEEFVKCIFEPFAREETAVTREIQGTGLGMAITKNIVDLMGGTISVESTKGKGSTFYVDLEFASAEEEDDGFWGRHGITRVLIVDDEEDVCLSIEELMAGTGVEISFATSGKAALDMIDKARESGEKYDIVLLDWKMPDMDGLETAKRIRALVGREVPILILTSYNFDEIEKKAKEASIDFFLPKPFFKAGFRRAVEQIKGISAAETAVAESSEISIDGMKILVAEDNEINAEIIGELLADEGVNCIIANNGKDAYDIFTGAEAGSFDMILMDIQMPIMNGYEATRAIRSCAHVEAKTIPIIAMTANAFEDDVKQSLDSGMNAHLAKPVDIDKLKKTIAAFRGNKK